MDRAACDRDRREPCRCAQAERQLPHGQRVDFEWRSRRPLGHRAARSRSCDRAQRLTATERSPATYAISKTSRAKQAIFRTSRAGAVRCDDRSCGRGPGALAALRHVLPRPCPTPPQGAARVAKAMAAFARRYRAALRPRPGPGGAGGPDRCRRRGCTLVDAITAANTDQRTAGCLTGSGADTITLPAGSTQTLTVGPLQLLRADRLPVITSAIVIDGNGSTIAARPAAPAVSHPRRGFGGDLTLQETTVTGGISSRCPAAAAAGSSTTAPDAHQQHRLRQFASFDYGAGSAAACSNYGTLTLTNSTVSGNSAVVSGGGCPTPAR